MRGRQPNVRCQVQEDARKRHTPYSNAFSIALWSLVQGKHIFFPCCERRSSHPSSCGGRQGHKTESYLQLCTPPVATTCDVLPPTQQPTRCECLPRPPANFAFHRLPMLVMSWKLAWGSTGGDQGSFECYFFNPASKECSDVATQGFLEGTKDGSVKVYRQRDLGMDSFPLLLNSTQRFIIVSIRLSMKWSRERVPR